MEIIPLKDKENPTMNTATHKIQNITAAPPYVGDYATECEEGRRRGHELVCKMRAKQLPPMLYHELLRLIDSGEPKGVVVGFCHVVSEAAIYGPAS